MTNYRFSDIPQELRSINQWIPWRFKGDTKFPIIPINQPDKFLSFNQAVAWHTRGQADGIGFVFTDHDPYTGVDLDKCLDGDIKAIQGRAKSVVEKLDSYTELSVSGKGIHVIVQGKLPQALKTAEIEIYSRDRFFIFTGWSYAQYGTEIKDRQDVLEGLMEENKPNRPIPKNSQGTIIKGERNQTLTMLAGKLRRSGLDEASLYAALASFNQSHCRPPLDEGEIGRISKSISRYSTPQTDPERISEILLEEVMATEIDWIFRPYLARGKVTIVQGVPGVGKSSLLNTWMACITRGYGYHTGYEHEPGGVLLVSVEEDLGLLAKNFTGNHTLVHVVGFAKQRDGDRYFNRYLDIHKDLATMRGYCQRVPSLRLIIIDPLTDYMDNPNRKDDVNKFYTALEELSIQYQCAVLCSVHLNKDPHKSAGQRASGAVSIIGRGCLQLQISEDKDDHELRHVIPIKVRYTEKKGLAFNYRIGDNREAIWDHSTAIEQDADEALRRLDPGEGTTRKWIRTALMNGPRRVYELTQLWKGEGFKDYTVQSARQRMGVVSYRDGGKVWWKLPDR